MESNQHALWFALLVVVALSSYGLYSDTRRELDMAKEEIAQLSEGGENVDLELEDSTQAEEDKDILEAAVQELSNVGVNTAVISSGAIIQQYAPSVVRLVCIENGGGKDLQQGSGTLFQGESLAGDSPYYIQTSLHVIETEDGVTSQCAIAVYPDPSNSEKYIVYKSRGYKLYGSGVDLAYIEPLVVENDKRAGSLAQLPFYALNDSTVQVCESVSIGEHVSVLGYPGIGGDSLTVTDGIVSGFEFRSGERYVKTSAKIDQGNSGGIAVMDSGCIVGVPTYVKTQIESLGRILDLKALLN